jgi:hypothetical protein
VLKWSSKQSSFFLSGYCPVNQTTGTTFQLENKGEIDAPFAWNDPSPFEITPMSGIVPKGKTMTMHLTLVPRIAEVYVTRAACRLGDLIGATKNCAILLTVIS